MVDINEQHSTRRNFLGEELTEAERVAFQVKLAMDSVDLVNEFIALADVSKEKMHVLRCNVQHLKTVVERGPVKNSSENLDPLHAAIAAGEAFLSANS